MTAALMESFQAEFVKRVWKWLRHHSNTAALVVIGVQSMKSWSADQKSLSGTVVVSWCNSITFLCLVKECRKAVWSAVHRDVERRAGLE